MPLPITGAAELPLEIWQHIMDQLPASEQLRFQLVSPTFRDLKSPQKIHELKATVLTSCFPQTLPCNPQTLVHHMLNDGWTEQEVVEIAKVLSTRRDNRRLADLQDAKLLSGLAVKDAL